MCDTPSIASATYGSVTSVLGVNAVGELQNFGAQNFGLGNLRDEEAIMAKMKAAGLLANQQRN